MNGKSSAGFEEGTHECRSQADALDRPTKGHFQLAEMERGEVGEFDLLEIAPDPLVGVEFGGVRGEILQREPTAVVVDEPPDRGGLVGVDVVPDEDDPAAHVPEQMPEEHEHLRGGNRAAADQDIKLPLRADARDGRELGPGIAVDDDGGLSPGGPGPNARRNQAEAGLVGEDQRGLLPLGFFLIRGHSWRSQRWTSRSSRSVARPVGLWYDHPHCRKSFGT